MPKESRVFAMANKKLEKNLTGKPYPEQVDAVVLSPKFPGLRDPTDAVQSLISDLDDDHERSGPNRYRKGEGHLAKETKRRASLGLFFVHFLQKGRPEQAMQTPLAPKSASRDLGAKTTFISPTKTSKTMANLFSKFQKNFSIKSQTCTTPMGCKS